MKKSILVLSLASLLLVACNKVDNKKVEEQTPTTTTEATATDAATTESTIDHAHTAENSLDWNGTYKGVLPCADCEGLETEIKLNLDKSYQLKETYLGKGNEKAFISKGTFHFDPNPNNSSVIQLDGRDDKRKYFVAEGYLKALDTEGHEITGELANQYELRKQD